MQVTLEIPDTFAASLTAAGKDPARTAPEALALEGYRSAPSPESRVRPLPGFAPRLPLPYHGLRRVSPLPAGLRH